ncbi:hypothetical protein ASF73_17285 [Xanthomonas sp. Leaf131]|nr:hypothetical protein ASF73_17285 [Xanthomonas sp. Leaf131]
MATKEQREAAFNTFVQKVTAVRGPGSGYVFSFNESNSCLQHLIPAMRADLGVGKMKLKSFKRLREALVLAHPNDSAKYKPALDWAEANYPFDFRDADIKIARQVCGRLLDVKIADVDFSPNVTKAAKELRLGDGRTLYDTIKQDFDTVVTDVVKEVRRVKKYDKDGNEFFQELLVPRTVSVDGAAERAPEQSKFYIDHDKAMSSAKVLNVGNKMGEDGLRIIALNVIQNRFAVCESIAATIVYQCRQQGFHGRIEWIGIPYGPKTGHAIVVAHREGDEVNNPSSWGDNWFIMDMWYYNLGMRDRYLWSTKQEQADYLQKDITDYIGVNGGLKLMGGIG